MSYGTRSVAPRFGVCEAERSAIRRVRERSAMEPSVRASEGRLRLMIVSPPLVSNEGCHTLQDIPLVNKRLSAPGERRDEAHAEDDQERSQDHPAAERLEASEEEGRQEEDEDRRHPVNRTDHPPLPHTDPPSIH